MHAQKIILIGYIILGTLKFTITFPSLFFCKNNFYVLKDNTDCQSKFLNYSFKYFIILNVHK